jgi:hypothetical protein
MEAAKAQIGQQSQRKKKNGSEWYKNIGRYIYNA